MAAFNSLRFFMLNRTCARSSWPITLSRPYDRLTRVMLNEVMRIHERFDEHPVIHTQQRDKKSVAHDSFARFCAKLCAAACRRALCGIPVSLGGFSPGRTTPLRWD